MKQVIALIASLMLVVPANASYDWGTNPGDGSADNPYQISTAEQLTSIGSDPNLVDKHYVLIANIDMDPAITGLPVFTASLIGIFTGVFDGADHEISNLTFAGSGSLFSKINPQGQVIHLGLLNIDSERSGLSRENLGLIADCYVTGEVNGSTSRTGGLCGINDYGGVISNCHAEVNITIKNSSGTIGGLCGSNSSLIVNCYATGNISGNTIGVIGGLCGSNRSSVINCYATGNVHCGPSQFLGGLSGENAGVIFNCYATGNVSSDLPAEPWEHAASIGGLCGVDYYGAITNCYATGDVSGNEYVGGLCGYGHVANCYATGTVSGNNRIGAICGSGIATNCFWNTDTGGPDNGLGTGLTTAEMKDISFFLNADWDFTSETTNGFADSWVMPTDSFPQLYYFDDSFSYYPFVGLGTESDPYLIANINDLAVMWQQPTSHYKLIHDMDLSPFTFRCAIIPCLDGTLDGDGYQITGFSLTGNNILGLIGLLETNASVTNLTLKNANIVSDYSYAQDIGTMCGRCYGTISRCGVTGSISGGYCYVGGLCGRYGEGRIPPQTISECYAQVNVTAANNSSYVGGFCGITNYYITDCYSMGNVSGYGSVGGFCGCIMNNHVSNSYSTGRVTSNGIGGFCGSCAPVSNIYNCFWDKETSGITTSDIGTGLTTTEMMAESTFTAAGWDFTTPIWKMLREQEDYPRLEWQEEYLGDIAGLYGVDLTDFARISNWWLETSCGDCDGSDISGDNNVDITDLTYLVQDWLKGK